MAQVIDGRFLEAPEPLELTLNALDTLPDGDELVVLLNCQPRPLYQILQRSGYVWTENWQADGSNEIRIRKA